MEVGNTPLVKVYGVGLPKGFYVQAKLEGENPTGSMKIRSAQRIVEEEKIQIGDTIIESTSGNMGVALAAVSLEKGIRCVLVVDPKLSPYHRREMLRYGAELVEVTEVDDTGGWLKTRLAKVKELVNKNGWFWINQYESPWNPRAFERLGAEIAEQAGSLWFAETRVWLFASVSTGGSLSGTASFLKAGKPERVRVVAVDAEGSAIFGGPLKKRYLNGIGSSIANPMNLRRDLIDDVCMVGDLEAFRMCHRLRKEGVWVGGSSGAVMSAICRYQGLFSSKDVVVGIFPDKGEIYEETLYSESWLKERGFTL